MDETIKYTADVVAVKPGGDVLLITREWPPHKGKLALPGGHVDQGETSRDAAVRELQEETGVQVAADDLVMVGVYDRPDRDPRGRYVSVAYAVRVPAGTVATAADDAAAVDWVSMEEFERGDMAFDHAEILADAKRTLR